MGIRFDRDLRYHKSRNKATTRPKTFSSEDAAKAYADKNGIKNYTLKNLKSSESQTKKIKIIVN